MERRTRDQRRSEYLEKLKDPRWQKRRLEIFQRDEFTCQVCFDTESTLHVHQHMVSAWRRTVGGETARLYESGEALILALRKVAQTGESIHEYAATAIGWHLGEPYRIAELWREYEESLGEKTEVKDE